MKLSGCLGALFFIALVGGCSKDLEEKFDVFSSVYDFSVSQSGWIGDFADYKIADSATSKLKFLFTDLPINLASGQKSLMLTGNNQSDNLFMFVKKKMTDLKPNTEYTLVYEVEFASNVPKGLPQGDDVYLKVGATTQEPIKIMEGGFYRMNIDKGVGNTGGQDMVVISSIGGLGNTNDYSLTNTGDYTSSSHPFINAKTDSAGDLWLVFGTDSNFKGTTTIYYTSLNVVFSVSK